MDVVMGCDYQTHFNLSVTFKDGTQILMVEVYVQKGYLWGYSDKIPKGLRR
jgi:hypothetical protein